MALFAGILFDLVGRKIILFVALALSAVCFTMFPWTSPSLVAFSALGALLQLFMAPVSSAPLI